MVSQKILTGISLGKLQQNYDYAPYGFPGESKRTWTVNLPSTPGQRFKY